VSSRVGLIRISVLKYSSYNFCSQSCVAKGITTGGLAALGARLPRPAKFDEDQILDAALRLVADGGPNAATIAAIADALGALVGSIYHLFRSRDLLLAKLWIRTVKRFQAGFLRALEADDLDAAALGAALHNLEWTREHPDEARVLLLYRREDLAERWPEELGGSWLTSTLTWRGP
jgi:AcrR family transcriptional regulator